MNKLEAQVNDLAVNQAIRSAFSRAGTPLHGTSVYVLEAMLWGLQNEAAGWADGKMLWQLEDQVGYMLPWDPETVITLLYNDGEGYDQDAMQSDADSFEDETPAKIASSLLETLMCEMD